MARSARTATSSVEELRAWYGLTQAQFASVLGVSERAVIRWEQGEAEPSELAHRQLAMLKDIRKRLLQRYSSDNAQGWLQEPHPALRRNTPLAVLITSGPLPVRDVLVGLEAGGYR